MRDKRGILRGRCTVCYCTEYISEGQLKCKNCNHVPTKHEVLGQDDVNDLSDGSDNEVQWESVENLKSVGQVDEVKLGNTVTVVKAWESAVVYTDLEDSKFTQFLQQCQFPGCNDVANFDLNTREYTSVYCYDHLSTAQPDINSGNICGYPGCGMLCYVELDGTTHDYCSKFHADAMHTLPIPTVQATSTSTSPPSVSGAATNASTMAMSGVAVCAIPECGNPCFVDQQGKVFECCGYTHAMELQRRKTMAAAPVVKGVTHCLLPECSSPVWPFMNYCGRGHADIGRQRGLQPPLPQDDQSTKPADCCILPGCRKSKYKDPDGTVHPYCGRTHAQLGKTRGISPKPDQDLDQDQDSSKDSNQCDFSGCTQPKWKEQDGTVLDYCCKDHADKDATNRDAKILKPRSEVDKYLQKFSNLKVVKIEENTHAKLGGALHNKFKDKYWKLPKHQRTTQLAFHGTPEANIQSICANGFDPSRRSGQAYGPGEYFAVSPNIPLGYCGGGKKMLLTELLLGQQGQHHTRHGDIVVMKDPAHDLPRFIITFQ